MIVLELGTGLTGIVLTAATTNVTVLLTDLKVVADQVTIPNVQRNIPRRSQHARTVTLPVPDRRPPGHQLDQNENADPTQVGPRTTTTVVIRTEYPIS
jgi:hypothetical protein